MRAKARHPHHRRRRRNRSRARRRGSRRPAPSIITLDVTPLDPTLAPLVVARVHRIDHRHQPARSHARRVRGRSRLSSGRAALDARRVHADRPRITSTSRARSTCSSSRSGRASRTAGRSCSSIRRRSPRTGCRIVGRRRGPGACARTSTRIRPRCTAATSCTASSWAATTPATTSSCRRTWRARVDFRAVRFPGLISAMTVPSGGTSDYAPEMIHAAVRGEPYECFVRPDTTIPFMVMPDGVDALLTLAAAPREALTRTEYNLRAFNPSAAEIRDVVLRACPGRGDHVQGRRRSGRRSSIRGRPTSTIPPRAPTGASIRCTISNARFASI